MSINILGSIIAGMVSMGIGFAWYSDALFGKKWRSEMGWSDENDDNQKGQGMTKMILGGFIAEFVMAIILSFILGLVGVTNIIQGLTLAFTIWLGFITTVMIGGVIYEKKTLTLYFINAGYRLVAILAMATLLILV